MCIEYFEKYRMSGIFCFKKVPYVCYILDILCVVSMLCKSTIRTVNFGDVE